MRMNMDGSCARGFRQRPVWLLAVAALVAGQAGLALHVFGGPAGLSDPRPVVAGRHPLHLYHGSLGADTFRHRSATACYDPAFQAGYPKTPVFDAGCRPAELVLVLAGGGFDPAAYKAGLFACCLLVPVGFAAAGRGAGLSRAGACLAGAAGCGVWWSPPVRAMFDAGDIDLLLAGLCAVVFVGWLPRYNWEPGVTSWLVLAGTAVVGWYAHPVVWLGLGPVVAAYYLAAAPRHGPAWHLGLAGVTAAGMAPNMWWLWDWGKFWWLRQPSVDDIAPLPTWGAVLGSVEENAALLGETPLGWPVACAAGAGLLWMLYAGQRTAPGVFLLAGAAAAAVARLGQVWPTLMAGGADRAAPLVAALAVVPAAAVVAAWWEATRPGRLLVLAAVALPAVAAWGGECGDHVRRAVGLDLAPLPLGLTAEQEEFARGLAEKTTADARILIEESDPHQPGWNWTALLPTLTGRVYLGGLDPEAAFEHAFCSLRADRLNGRPLGDWADAELTEFCRRYNVGWVACRSPAAAARWRAYPPAREVGRFADGGEVVLFELDRPRSFVLAGSATWAAADRRKVVLTDVVPADAPHPNGGPAPAKVVVLSLHHQAGLRVSPGMASVERDPDPFDPIPMIRLRVPGPMARVVISWENP
jgi:hypothetical protein